MTDHRPRRQDSTLGILLKSVGRDKKKITFDKALGVYCVEKVTPKGLSIQAKLMGCGLTPWTQLHILQEASLADERLSS